MVLVTDTQFGDRVMRVELTTITLSSSVRCQFISRGPTLTCMFPTTSIPFITSQISNEREFVIRRLMGRRREGKRIFMFPVCNSTPSTVYQSLSFVLVVKETKINPSALPSPSTVSYSPSPSRRLLTKCHKITLREPNFVNRRVPLM